jgi:hypothetical protein
MRKLIFSVLLLCALSGRSQTVSGIGIPTIFSTNHAGTVAMGYSHFIQVDTVVFVWGQLSDAQFDTPIGQKTSVTISIPVVSNLTAFPFDTYGFGTVYQNGNIQPINAFVGGVSGASDRVVVSWYRTSAFSCTVNYSYTYAVRQ